MSVTLSSQETMPRAGARSERRVTTDIRNPPLDGLRGLMTLFVRYPHFFVEVPHGMSACSMSAGSL